MEINGLKLARVMQRILKQDVQKTKKKKPLKLATFLIGESDEQLSFVRIKSKLAKKLRIGFELIHNKKVPFFEDFMHSIKEKSLDPKITGIIIQQPLPAQLSTASIYDYIPENKEIEGHQHKPLFLPPLGLTVLTILKYIYGKARLDRGLFIDPRKDKILFKKILRSKKIVLIGRGITGGQPIGQVLSEFKINYIGINSKTPDPQNYLREADIIISAVGKKIITPDIIKPGVILISAGLRREKGRLRGDYDEKEIKDIASFYTPTPGGAGPLDVLYLYKNLIEARKMQK